MRGAYRRATGRVPAPADEDDAIACILRHLWDGKCRALKGYRRDLPLRPWLWTVSYRVALNLLRSARAAQGGSLARVRDLGDAIEDLAGPAGRGVPDEAATHERAERVHAALGRLASRDRLLLRMVYFDGRTHPQVAAALRIGVDAVEIAVRRARARLGAILDPSRPGDVGGRDCSV